MSDTQRLEDELGIDPRNFDWKSLALCQETPTEDFYDNYEASDSLARVIDEVCLSCPVMTQCLERGMDGNEWGVWGGIYLVSGKPDKNKNSHKSQEVWDEIRSRIDE